MAATTITRTSVNLTDDSGSGTDGTVFNAAWATAFMDAIDDLLDGTKDPLIVAPQWFTVQSADATTGIRIDNTAADGDAVIHFQLSGTTKFSIGVDDGDDDKLKIGTTAIGSSTRLTIDSSGNIGFGTEESPANIMDAKSSGTALSRLTSTGAGATGVETKLRHSSGSPADNDRIAKVIFLGNDSGATERETHKWDLVFDDVTSTTLDSSMGFHTMSNVNAGNYDTEATLSSAGVWTDSSDRKAKEYDTSLISSLFPKDGATDDDRARGSLGGSVCQRISRMTDGRYHAVNLPPGKTPVWYGGPDAQSVYVEFGLGDNPKTPHVDQDGNTRYRIGLAPKNGVAVCLWGIQELMDENTAVRLRLDALEAEE